jgi:hypothetical protein
MAMTFRSIFFPLSTIFILDCVPMVWYFCLLYLFQDQQWNLFRNEHYKNKN